MMSSDLWVRLWKEKRLACNGTSLTPIKSLNLENYLIGEATQYSGKHRGFRIRWPSFGLWLIHLASHNFYEVSTVIIIILENKICIIKQRDICFYL